MVFFGLILVPDHASWVENVLTGSKTGRIYDPMDHPGLGRVFANLEKTDEAIQAFTLRWGLLDECPMSRHRWHAAIDEMVILMRKLASQDGECVDVLADLGEATCRFAFEQGKTVCYLPDLLTCLKVQAGLAASEGWEFTACEYCGVPFVKTGRKRFCSTVCRVKAHQRRGAAPGEAEKSGRIKSPGVVIGGVRKRQLSRIVIREGGKTDPQET